MTNGSGIDTALLEGLSALADGELDAAAAASACAGWRGEAQIRSSWHAYQLIGDVLRSDDLAVDPARDLAFLAAFRDRLAREPVVIAPNLPGLPRQSRAGADDAGARTALRGGWMWKTGSAVAVGFVAVAGVFMLTRTGAPDAPAATTLARADAPVAVADGASERQQAALVSSPATPVTQASIANGNLIRDARLDRYLAAHKQFAGSSALVMPSAFLRNATVESPGR